MSYSIAIRTLGTAGDKFNRELQSIACQTLKPEKVVIYIAQGYARPTGTIGIEQYVEVPKGMVAQRALPYAEIDSDYILLLDDDMELSPDCAERLMGDLERDHLDCVAADPVGNHKKPLSYKVRAMMGNLVFPHWSRKWAFKIHSCGSFTYNAAPQPRVYLSQSAAGAVSMWRKDALLAIHFADELWLDRLKFAFGDDAIMFNKLYKNGYRLGVDYGCKVTHLDSRSSSGAFHKRLDRFYSYSFTNYVIWYRSCFDLDGQGFSSRAWCTLTFYLKCVWLFFYNLAASVACRSPRVIGLYIKGLRDGMAFVRSPLYKRIPNYIVPRTTGWH